MTAIRHEFPNGKASGKRQRAGPGEVALHRLVQTARLLFCACLFLFVFHGGSNNQSIF